MLTSKDYSDIAAEVISGSINEDSIHKDFLSLNPITTERALCALLFFEKINENTILDILHLYELFPDDENLWKMTDKVMERHDLEHASEDILIKVLSKTDSWSVANKCTNRLIKLNGIDTHLLTDILKNPQTSDGAAVAILDSLFSLCIGSLMLSDAHEIMNNVIFKSSYDERLSSAVRHKARSVYERLRDRFTAMSDYYVGGDPFKVIARLGHFSHQAEVIAKHIIKNYPKSFYQNRKISDVVIDLLDRYKKKDGSLFENKEPKE